MDVSVVLGKSGFLSCCMRLTVFRNFEFMQCFFVHENELICVPVTVTNTHTICETVCHPIGSSCGCGVELDADLLTHFCGRLIRSMCL